METNITKINVGGTLLPVNDPNVCDNFEDGNTASKTYNAGEFLIWKGSLYKVTTTIAQGATFTDGVNLEDATITELLEAVNTALSTKQDILSFGTISDWTALSDGMTILGLNINTYGKLAFIQLTCTGQIKASGAEVQVAQLPNFLKGLGIVTMFGQITGYTPMMYIKDDHKLCICGGQNESAYADTFLGLLVAKNGN